MTAQIIDGKQEARIIFLTHRAQHLAKNHAYLYIDVGGGSTELTLMHQDQTIDQRSFDIGTIRLLNNLVTEDKWKEMKTWIKQHCSNFETISAVGSGGNINKIFRLSAKKEHKPLNIKDLTSIKKTIESYTFEERIIHLGLRPDRADVILPASQIFLSVMHWGQIRKIYVPQIGLADGLIHQLYEQYRQQH